MSSTKSGHTGRHARVLAFALACLAIWLATFGPMPRVARAQDKKLSIYSPQSSYSVSVIDRDGGEYVGLVDILEPLGRVDARADGKKWTLNFVPAGASSPIEAKFSDAKKKGKVRGSNFDLPADFALINSRGYVPIASLPNLLPRILDLTVQMRQPARRLFIGATPMRYTAELRKGPSRLILTFPRAVSPFIATEPGRLRMVFAKDALISAGADNTNFGDPLITSLQFSEGNGSAEIAVGTGAPVLANFSDNGRTITIAAAPQQQAAVPAPSAPVQHETPLPPPPPGPSKRALGPLPARFLVVIDAAHGGDERGALLTPTLAEKDVTQAFARRLFRELEARGIAAAYSRSADNTVTFDQRAQASNTARASLFITVHASSMGNGIRLYTAMMPASATPPNRRQFLPWETAQAPYLDLSTQVAGSFAAECNTRNIAIRALPSALRPLNSIAAPAIGVELAPPGDKVDDVNDAKYQQNLAAALVAGIAAMRNKLEAPQ